MAVMCSFISSFWCESIKFEATGVYNASVISGTPKDVQVGAWYTKGTEVIQVGTGSDATFFVREVCNSYSNDIEIDAKWKTVRAFSIMAPIIGSIAAVFVLFANCLYFFNAKTWKSMAMLFIVILTLFQGLTFLLLNSNACSENPLLAEAPPSGFAQDAWISFIDTAYKQDCTWDAGMTTNVVAVVSWFLTGVAMLAVGVPTRPPLEPAETQEVTYEKTIGPDGTTTVAETGVIKGTAVPPPEVEQVSPAEVKPVVY